MLISVRDTGIGVSPAEQERLFQAFGQAQAHTQREFGGTGLGLTICQRLAALMGGTVTMHSTPGVGTTMEFEVPLPVGTLDDVDPMTTSFTHPFTGKPGPADPRGG